MRVHVFCFFFFNDAATTEIYTLSLHDALPISRRPAVQGPPRRARHAAAHRHDEDRKSTRPNSSHSQISYAVFCLKKKKNNDYIPDAQNQNKRSLSNCSTSNTPQVNAICHYPNH